MNAEMASRFLHGDFSGRASQIREALWQSNYEAGALLEDAQSWAAELIPEGALVFRSEQEAIEWLCEREAAGAKEAER